MNCNAHTILGATVLKNSSSLLLRSIVKQRLALSPTKFGYQRYVLCLSHCRFYSPFSIEPSVGREFPLSGLQKSKDCHPSSARCLDTARVGYASEIGDSAKSSLSFGSRISTAFGSHGEPKILNLPAGSLRINLELRRYKSSSSNGHGSNASQNTATSNKSDLHILNRGLKSTKTTTASITNKHILDRLPTLAQIHRPTKEELLAAATGFWSRLKVRFKWFSIRSVRPFNIDEIGAFFSWVLLGHVLWVILGTTTFFSLAIFAVNTVFAQGLLAPSSSGSLLS